MNIEDSLKETQTECVAQFGLTTKFVIEGTDELGFITGGSANVDVTVSYLDQTL